MRYHACDAYEYEPPHDTRSARRERSRRAEKRAARQSCGLRVAVERLVDVCEVVGAIGEDAQNVLLGAAVLGGDDSQGGQLKADRRVGRRNTSHGETEPTQKP